MKVAQPVVKVLGICGSLKKASVNRGALVAMQTQAARIGVDMKIADLSEIPFFNPDVEHEVPPAVQTLLEQMIEADAFVLATPGVQLLIHAGPQECLGLGESYTKYGSFQGKSGGSLECGRRPEGGSVSVSLAPSLRLFGLVRTQQARNYDQCF